MEKFKKASLTVLIIAVVALILFTSMKANQDDKKCKDVLSIIDTKNVYALICKPSWYRNFKIEMCDCDIYYKRGKVNGTTYLSQVKVEIYPKGRTVIWKGMTVE